MKAFFIALAAWLALIAPADAQTGSSKNTTQLIIEVGQEFPDNNLGLITPFNARQFQLDLLASTPNFSTAGTFTAAQAFNGGATAPTRSPGDSTTNVATTAFVTTAAANILATANTWSALQTFDAGIITAGAGWSCSITTGPTTDQCFNTSQVTTGGTTSVPLNLNQMLVQEGITGGTNFINALGLIHNVVGGNGGRQSFQISTNIFNTSTWSALTSQFFVSFEASIMAAANVGGTSTSAPAGAMFAYNPECFLKSGATFWAQLTCQETDVDVETGASVAYLAGMSIVQQATHSQQGFRQDVALAFTNFLGAAGWQCLVCAGSFGEAESPFGQSGANGATYIGLLAPGGGHAAPGFKYGVDFSLADPTGTDLSSGFAFRSGVNGAVNFSVNWSGGVNATAAAISTLFATSATVTGSFTATGLVTNADLVSPTVTVNSVACTLGSTCTITAAAALTVASTTISGSCTNGFNLYNNGGVLGCQANGGGGGGNVSSSGSPTNGQIAQWVTSTTIQGITLVPVTAGGSGAGSFTANAFLTGNGTSAFNAVAITGLVLGNGASAPGAYGGATCTNQFITVLSAAGSPTCTSVTNAFLTAGTFSNITGVGTLTAGGTSTGFTVALGASTITGQLALANGGTAANLTASNGGILYSGASALAILNGTVTASLPLLSGSSTSPSWAAISYPTSASSGGIPYFSSTSTMASSATLGAFCIVYGGGGGIAPATSSSNCPTVSAAGAISLTNNTQSVSPSTGALVLQAGGLGVAGNIIAGGPTFQFGNTTAATSVTFSALGPNSGTGTAVGASFSIVNGAVDSIIFGNRSAALGLVSTAYDSTPTFYANTALDFYVGTVTLANYSAIIGTFNTAATSTTTGTFQVQGGIAASAASWHAGLTVTGVFNINAISGGGTATKYVCVDASGNMLTQSAAC